MKTLTALIASMMLLGQESAPDPMKDGPHTVGWTKTTIEDLESAIFYPAKAAEENSAADATNAPRPVLIFSPGGPAKSCAGYDDFARRMASWGFIAVVVAFGDKPAEQRAPQFLAVRARLEKMNADASWVLKGVLDMKTVIAGGHSRGGAAAILAAADAKKFSGCLAIAPALQKIPARDATPTFLIGGPSDSPTATGLYDGMPKPRWQLNVAGMDHFLVPAEKRELTVGFSAAWMGMRFLKKDAFKPWVGGDQAKKARKDGLLADVKVDE